MLRRIRSELKEESIRRNKNNKISKDIYKSNMQKKKKQKLKKRQ